MNIFKRELKINLKSFIIWTACISGLYFLLIIAYPSIIGSVDMDIIYQMFPSELLKAFNLDISDISTAMGWIASEGIIFYIIVGALYSGMLGMNIVLKEESDKTIDFLYSKPISKNRIMSEKIISAVTYITLFSIASCLLNIVAFSIIGQLEFWKIVLLYLSPLMIFYCVFSLCLFLSTLKRKTKQTTALCFGIVFGFYFVQIISSISDKVSFLKYFTIFSLSDTRYLLTNSMFNPWCALITLVFVGIFLTLSYLSYNKKEFF